MDCIKLITIMVLALSTVMCGKGHQDGRLTEIYKLSSENPIAADSMLSLIDKKGLNEYDRHYHDLLRIRIDNKQFRKFDSDSLILDVIDYFSDTSDDMIICESLYLGGSVLREMGDYPQAYDYFAKAISHLPQNKNSNELRAILYSQMAHLLERMRMHEEAIYYVNNSIETDIASGDYQGALMDYNTLSEILIGMGKLDTAKIVINHLLALDVPDKHNIKQEGLVNLARIYREKNNIDSALSIIRNVDLTGDTILMNYALSTASEIYKDANIIDTSYMYAKMIVDNAISNNKTSGYKLLLSPELQKGIPDDSLRNYLLTYRDLLESYYNMNDAQAVTFQKSFYNYNRHLEQKKKATKKNDVLMFVILCFICLILAVTSITVILKLKNRNMTIQLQDAILDIDSYKEKLSAINQKLEETKSSIDRRHNIEEIGEVECKELQLRTKDAEYNELLRKQCREKYLSLNIPDNVSDEIIKNLLNSDIHALIDQHLMSHQAIPDNAPLWMDIKELISQHFPDFFARISLLSEKKIKPIDMRYLMLVKFGYNPTNIGILLSISTAGITFKRKSMSKRLFNKNLDNSGFTKIIQLIQ